MPIHAEVDAELVVEPKFRRIVRIPMDADSIRQALLVNRANTGERISHSVEGLPDDAVYCGCSWDPYSLSLNFFFEHPSFDLVPEGHAAPILSVTHHIDITAPDPHAG